jgi:hypothetical protein
MTLPYKEPSQVLYSLLGTIVEEGRRLLLRQTLKSAICRPSPQLEPRWQSLRER